MIKLNPYVHIFGNLETQIHKLKIINSDLIQKIHYYEKNEKMDVENIPDIDIY